MSSSGDTADDDFVASPCVHICCLDLATDLCMGCLRTRDELATWPTLSSDDRRRVLARVAQRKAEAPPSDVDSGA